MLESIPRVSVSSSQLTSFTCGHFCFFRRWACSGYLVQLLQELRPHLLPVLLLFLHRLQRSGAVWFGVCAGFGLVCIWFVFGLGWCGLVLFGLVWLGWVWFGLCDFV